MINKFLQIPISNGRIINCNLRISDIKPKPFIFFLHGFKSFREWGFIPYSCEYLAKNGFNVINFDYYLNGIVDSRNSLFDEEKFSKQTFSSHLNDFVELYKTILTNEYIDEFALKDIWNNEVYTIGHSMGGALSILASEKIKIDKIVLWASIAYLIRATPRQRQIWKERGWNEIVIQASQQVLKLDYNFVEDRTENFNEECVIEALSTYKNPYLVVHADKDLIIKKIEKERLISAQTNNNGSLFVIEATGHTFSVGHPFTGSNKHLSLALQETIKFLNSNE